MGEFENIQVPWKEWKIVRDLGHGGFGSVYEIERELFGRRERAAMKVLVIPKDQSEVEADFTDGYDERSIRKKYEDYRDKVIQEYQLMSEMKGHTNIVNCDDVAVLPLSKGIGWKVYIRMELLTPLEKKLRSETLSIEQVTKLGIDICKALSLCEKKKIIHRDVKPANIMVSEFGDYKLGDFGVARTMDHTTNATSIGTEKYMAPEVIKREKYGKEADLYSLGLVLYWLLNNRRMPFVPTNRIPTQEEVNSAQSRRIRGEIFEDPLNGNAALKQVVKKACAYNPKDRYRSAQEMMEALQATQLSAKDKGLHTKSTDRTWGYKDYLNKDEEDTVRTAGTVGKGQNSTIGNGEADVSKTIGVHKDIRPTAAQRVQMRQNVQKSEIKNEKKIKQESEKVNIKVRKKDLQIEVLFLIMCMIVWFMQKPYEVAFHMCFYLVMPIITLFSVYILKNTLAIKITIGVISFMGFADILGGDVLATIRGIWYCVSNGVEFNYKYFSLIEMLFAGVLSYFIIKFFVPIVMRRKNIWMSIQNSDQEKKAAAKVDFSMFVISISLSFCYEDIFVQFKTEKYLELLIPIVLFFAIFYLGNRLLAGLAGGLAGIFAGTAFAERSSVFAYHFNLYSDGYYYVTATIILIWGIFVAINSWKLAGELKK